MNPRRVHLSLLIAENPETGNLRCLLADHGSNEDEQGQVDTAQMEEQEVEALCFMVAAAVLSAMQRNGLVKPKSATKQPDDDEAGD